MFLLEEMQARDPEYMLSQKNIGPILALQEEFYAVMQKSDHQVSHAPHSRFMCLFFVLREVLEGIANDAHPGLLHDDAACASSPSEEELTTTEGADYFLGEGMRDASDDDLPMEGIASLRFIENRHRLAAPSASISFLPAPPSRSGAVYLDLADQLALYQGEQPRVFKS